MIHVTVYQPGDVFLRENWRAPVDMELDRQFMTAVSFSIYHNEKLVAIQGSQKIWANVAQVFMLVHDDIVEAPLGVYKEIKKALKSLAIFHDLRKVYAIIDSTSLKDIRWIESLGFTSDYVMKEAGPDHQDMIGYCLNY